MRKALLALFLALAFAGSAIVPVMACEYHESHKGKSTSDFELPPPGTPSPETTGT